MRIKRKLRECIWQMGECANIEGKGGGRARGLNRSLQWLIVPAAGKPNLITTDTKKRKKKHLHKKQKSGYRYQLNHSGGQHQAGSWGPRFWALACGWHFWTCPGPERNPLPRRGSPRPDSVHHKLTEKPLGLKRTLTIACQHFPWACGDDGYRKRLLCLWKGKGKWK